MAHNDLTLLGADLASAVRSQPTCRVRWGVITATAGHTCSVQLGGVETAVDGIRYLSSYGPVIGETVALLYDGADIFVIGTLADYDTGWITVSTGSDSVLWRRVGRTVTVVWYSTVAINSGSNRVVGGAGVIPAEARPALNVAASVLGYLGTPLGALVDTAGTITLYNASGASSSNNRGTATYVV